MQKRMIDRIGACAVEAMLYEVSATPKPGLVDRANNGAHHDMDFFTFMSSAAALRGSFDAFARIGVQHQAGPLHEMLPALQQAGRTAEQQMFALTQGVNTHKGMIFSLGMLAGAAGRLAAQGETLTAEKLCRSVAALCTGITAAAYAGIREQGQLTKGEAMYLKYGVTGVRGEVENGFPTVRRAGLPVCRELREKGLAINDVLVGTLIALIAENQDTNILGRHDLETFQAVQQAAKDVLALGSVGTEAGRRAIRSMDEEFIKGYISPGGSADLVAVTHFLYEMER